MLHFKIIQHYMPWEIDYMLLSFSQLKKSKYYLPKDIKVTIEVDLNLSSYIINWDKSKLPKEFFINKAKQLSYLLKDYEYTLKVYDGNELYGGLDAVKKNISVDTDFYISICPDMYFSETLLSYITQFALKVPNKYFIITPQISKLWDYTWDEITNPLYQDIPYEGWNEADIFDIRYNNKISTEEISLYPTIRSKWAGWCDLYNKAFYEELCPMQKEWKGYGPWDWYSMMLTEYVKTKNIDFQQYLLKGETIFEYSVGPLKDGGFSKYYKDLLTLNDIPNQRQEFEKNMKSYLDIGLEHLRAQKILLDS